MTAAFANLFNKFSRPNGDLVVNQFDIGRDAHETLQDNRIREFRGAVFAEAYGDQGGAYFGGGRVDLINEMTHELWEIKPDNPQGRFQGLAQAALYSAQSLLPPSKQAYILGGPSILPEGVLMLNGEFAQYTYKLARPGVIVYDYALRPGVQYVPFPLYLLELARDRASRPCKCSLAPAR